jgi:hypothetical protein
MGKLFERGDTTTDYAEKKRFEQLIRVAHGHQKRNNPE